MSDLIELLRGWAERDTAMSEFGPDEHIAGIAADEIERLTAEGERKQAQLDTIKGLHGDLFRQPNSDPTSTVDCEV